MSCFLLTLTNPMTVIAFVAIFAGLGLASYGADYGAAGIVVVGVFLGSAGWWLALSGLVGLWRKRITPQTMVWINRTSGGIIAGFGLGALLTALL